MCNNFVNWAERRKEDINADAKIEDKSGERAKVDDKIKGFRERFAFTAELRHKCEEAGLISPEYVLPCLLSLSLPLSLSLTLRLTHSSPPRHLPPFPARSSAARACCKPTNSARRQGATVCDVSPPISPRLSRGACVPVATAARSERRQAVYAGKQCTCLIAPPLLSHRLCVCSLLCCFSRPFHDL